MFALRRRNPGEPPGGGREGEGQRELLGLSLAVGGLTYPTRNGSGGDFLRQVDTDFLVTRTRTWVQTVLASD